jgi:hypothetical protein
MAWTDLTFVECSVLSAAKMTQLQGNFAALSAGEAGAPPLHIDGVSSLAWLHASSGVLAPQVSSLGTLHVASGVAAPGVNSVGMLQVGSGVLAPQVSSLATLHVSSEVVLGASPAGTPLANGLYKGNVCKAWINFDGTGTISIRDSFNVTSITDNAVGDYTVTWDRDFASSVYTVVGIGRTIAGVTSVFIEENAASAPTAGAFRLVVVRRDNGGTIDTAAVHLVAFGEQS